LNIDFSGPVDNSYHQLNPQFLMGYFFEGLTSFLLARRSSGDTSTKWIDRGDSMLTRMRSWSEHSKWNWENKMLLLEAESMYTKGEFDRAESLFDSAIRSAHEHRFIHEEAIASELAGMFYQEMGNHQKSYLYLAHSLECYEKWGAHAVARRVGSVIRDRFGPDICQLETGAVAPLQHLFASSQGKKRQQEE
jgi:tetratricopeptide (TPR) repeat protein